MKSRLLLLLWALAVLPVTGQTLQRPDVPPADAQSIETTESPATTPVRTRVGLALVVGNSDYAQAELPTVNRDRETMVQSLRSLGFTVSEARNLQRPRDFEDALTTLLEREDAVPEDILLVYYSGHGLQIDGKPYLLGTGMRTSGDISASVREYSKSVEEVISQMEQAAPAARVLIIDACRNNAFAGQARKAGAAFQRGVEDTYILFADEPGKTVPARTDTSLQSPFTAGLLFAFETSEEGLAKRFEIARDKTRQLNPDQNPQLEYSDPSPGRNLPFIDHGGRSAPIRSAVKILVEAEKSYKTGSWKDFQGKVRAARILSSETGLTARLEKESEFAAFVLSAQDAEGDRTDARWAEAGAAWQKAAAIFPVRSWALERAALAWLQADHLEEAVAALARLQTHTGTPVATRAGQVLAGVVAAFPSLDAVARSARIDYSPPNGVEFEPYTVQP